MPRPGRLLYRSRPGHPTSRTLRSNCQSDVDLQRSPRLIRPVPQSQTSPLFSGRSLPFPHLPAARILSLLATMSDAIAPAMHTDAEHEKHSEHSSADVEELAAKGHHAPAFYAQADAVPKTAGVLRMEAVARAKNTKSGRQQLYIIAACVVLMYFVRPEPSRPA